MSAATLERGVGERPSSLSIHTAIGEYRIDGVIGTGGMATVYRATQTMIGKRVAIKIMHRSKSDTAISRFVKEARAVNLIGHPNIVDVFGFGMMDHGRPYLVMELLEGETLAVRAERKVLAVKEVAGILIEVSLALEAAHEAGIIHRDLKPENIFLTKRNQVKLLDFGIAKLFGEGDLGTIGDDTRPGVVIGTPRYISPEQVRGTALDGRVDVYALGVVAFELLAHRQLFSANNPYDMLQKHAKLRPPKPSAFNEALPAEVDALISEMLAKDPEDRPTLAAVRARLAALRAPRAIRPRASATFTTGAATAVRPSVVSVVPDGESPVDAARARQTTDVDAAVASHTTSQITTERDPAGERRRFAAKPWVIAGVLAGLFVGAGIAVALRPVPETAGFAVPAVAPAPTPAPAVDDGTDQIVIDPVAHDPAPVDRTVGRKRPIPRPRPSAAAKPDADDKGCGPAESAP